MLTTPDVSTQTIPEHIPASCQRRSTLTWRSVLIGLAGVAFLSAITPYNDYHLHQTYLYGNHFPVGCLFLFVILALVVNSLIRLVRPGAALRQMELLTVWAMLITGSSFASSGLMRYLGPIPVAPFYYASDANRWGEWSKTIPQWMVPSTDPQSPTVKWFFEGLPPGADIPWQPWLHVFAYSGLLFALLTGFSIFACSLVRRQWVEREKLVFPLVHIPIEMAKEPQNGIVNSFFRSRLMWLGVGVSFGVHLLNGLHQYWFSVPKIPITYEVWQLWRNPPWSALGLWSVNVYFSVIGLSYLLPSGVSFSIWASFLLLRLNRVMRLSMGFAPTTADIPNNEAAYAIGGFVVWGLWLVWVARGHLMTVWRRVTGASTDSEETEPIPLRVSAVGALVCFLGIVAWTKAAGASVAFAFGLWATFALILLILTRIIAESGLLMVQTPFVPTESLSAALGTRFFNASGLAPGMMTQIIWMHDPREAYMPSVINALRLKGEDSGRGLLAAVVMATMLGFAVSFVSFLYVSYTYGGATLDSWGNRVCPAVHYGRLVGYMDYRTGTNWPVVTNIGLGGAVSVLLIVLHKNYLWWSLQPIGLVMAPTYAVLCVWFSVMIAWACKRLAMLGGYKTYRMLLPFFLGMVLGDGLAAGLWVIVGMFTGVGVWYFLPA